MLGNHPADRDRPPRQRPNRGVLPVVIQEGINTQLIPAEYHALLLSVVLPALAYIGRKIAQPKIKGDT